MSPPVFLARPGDMLGEMLAEPACLTIAQLMQSQPWRLELTHDRPHHLLLWVTRGQGRATVMGVRRGVGAHNALFIPAGTLMSFTLAPQSFGQAVLFPPGMGLNWPKIPAHLRVRDVRFQAEFTGLIDSLQHELASKLRHRDEALNAQVALMSVWFRRQFDETRVPDPNTPSQALVMKFASLVSRDYATGRSMSDLAEELGVTPTHLTRTCRANCGKTAADLLTERLLYQSRILLGTHGPTARDISEYLGFGSPAYFSRFILQHTGKTPGQLRARIRQTAG